MKNSVWVAGVLAGTLGLAGCSSLSPSNLLGGGPSSDTVQANQDLSMPPDLQLHPPQATTNVQTASATQTAVNPVTGATQPQGDIYQQYGISKVHADGSPKTDMELRKELQEAILLRKRQQNPNYGTVWNWGALFGG